MRKINAKLLLGLLIGTLVCTGVVFGVHHFQYGRIADSLLWQARRAEEQGQVTRQARYLQRYLEFNRKDLAAKAQLARLWTSAAFDDAPRERFKAVRLLDDVLSNGEDNSELRRLLVKAALETGQLKMARTNLEKLLTREFLDTPNDADAPAEQRPDPLRGEAIGYAGQLHEAENLTDKALKCYALAMHHAPEIQSNYLNAALLLRRQNQLDPTQNSANVSQADRLLDEMVKNNRLSHEAYLARWRYRRDFDLINLRDDGLGQQVKLKDAANDVEEALQRAPEAIPVLLAAADLERLEAQAALTHSGEANAKEKERKTHRDKALAYLEQALKLHAQKGRITAFDSMQFQLLWHKAGLLLDDIERMDVLGTDEDAAKNAGRRRAWSAEVADAIARIRKTRGAPAAADFLQARLLLQDRRWAEAVTLFEQVRPTLGTQLNLSGQINRYLGQCYEQLVEPSQMFKSYERLMDSEPNSVAAQLGMAQAEWMLGHLEKAALLFQGLAQSKKMPAKVWIDFARLEIQRRAQLEQPKWSEVEQLLTTAEKANPGSIEVPVVRAQFLLARDGRCDEARAVLLKAQSEPERSNNVELWTARIFLEVRDKKPSEARKILAEAKKQLGQRVVLLRLAEGRLLAEEKGDGYEKAINGLADDAEQFKEDDRARLLGGLADLQANGDNLVSARRLWHRVAELPSKKTDLPLHLLLFDLANKADDEPGMRQALDDIRALEGNQGPFHRYGEALRLLSRAKNESDEKQQRTLDEARSHLDRVQSIRPNWPPQYLARAQVERLADRKDLAINNLQEAVNQGETSTPVIRDLVELLADAGRYKEADEALKRVREPLMIQSDLGRKGAAIAAHLNDTKRAEYLLRKNRAKEGTQNYRELLWEGRMLAETNNPAEAEKKLRAALELANREPEAYVMMVQFLMRQKREEEIDPILEQARKRLPKQQVELTLGQCYEMLGRKKSAQAQYEQALSSHPQDAAAVRFAAGFYWNAGQLSQAEPLMRDLIEKRVKNPSAEVVAWARRHLALVLASGTDYGRFREALELVGLKLDKNGQLVRDAERERTEGTDTRRFQARVLAAQAGHRQFRQRARELLEELERNKALPADDRFILAMIYEAEGGWSKARAILSELAVPNEPAPRHLAFYVQTLIEHQELDEATKQIDKLEALELERGSEPNAFAAIELRARLYEERKQGEKAIALLEKHIQRKKANPNEILLLLNSMRRQKAFAQAYDRCIKAWEEKQCSPEVIGGASVAVLRGMQANGTPASHDQIVRVETYLNKALEANPKSVVLMLHLAELYDHRGRWEQAEATYRRVLEPENEPKNIVALNNLAWILAQRSSDPHKIEEALTRIETAVHGIGKRADLIDTRGLVYVKLGHDAAALTDFREAVSDMPTPTHLFHLARAYLKTSDRTNALKAIKQAREMGLQASVLHPSEHDAYQKILRDLKVQ